MKKILGLDLGTNSIGWAMVSLDEENYGNDGHIIDLGSRIIPMDGDAIQKFESGKTASKAEARRIARGTRRMNQRYKLRRTRLIKVFKALQWIDPAFPENFKTYRNDDPNKKYSISQFLPFTPETIREASQVLGLECDNGSVSFPEDWIVYYLRKKALTKQISLAELVRIVYMMNQRRGFKSSRKDVKGAAKENVIEMVEKLVVSSVEELPKEHYGAKRKFRVTAGEYTWELERNKKPEWLGQERFMKITKTTLKDGTLNTKITVPEEDDYLLKIEALKRDIASSDLEVGEYFFNQLVRDRNYKIRQRIVDRSLYKKEFERIWQTQCLLNPALQKLDTDKVVLQQIAGELYKHNEDRKQILVNQSLGYILSEDIIYYKRNLKSQKNTIAYCRYEKRKGKDGLLYGVQVAAKSSPEFQEYRIWQQIHNMAIIERQKYVDGKLKLDVDITDYCLTPIIKESLLELFDSKKEVAENEILRLVNKGFSDKTHYINLFYQRDADGKAKAKLLGNETKSTFYKVFKKHGYETQALLSNSEAYYTLWHLYYSLDQHELYNPKPEGGFSCPKKFIEWGFSEELIKDLANQPELPRQYASLSAKAIHKLLPLMREGCYFDYQSIDNKTKQRIDKLINGEITDELPEKLYAKLAYYISKGIDGFRGMPNYLAAYVVYGRHSEDESIEKYASANEIDTLKLIPHNSMRNPVVEQVVRETLNLVKDVFAVYGQPNEIHIELSRDLKKTAKEREEMTNSNFENQREREKIKSLLRELAIGSFNSPSDIEKLRLWKNTGGRLAQQQFDELFDRKNQVVPEKLNKFKADFFAPNAAIFEPSRADIEKYRLWQEQNFCSPYTGNMIPLSKLFTAEYEVEHVIPRSRYFDDSFANKTICEAAVNSYKENLTGMQLIRQDGGKTIEHKGTRFTLLNEETYTEHCKRTFKGKKFKNFLCDEIPDGFIAQQLNNTKYISRKIAELLKPVASDKEGIVFTGGAITSELKEQWGLHRIWKQILLPRFERLEEVTNENWIEQKSVNNDIHFKTDYKRIDHRHHALDALIIATTTRSHINYLNALNSHEGRQKYKYLTSQKTRDFVQPWPEFSRHAKQSLEKVVVSFKTNNRVVSNTVNKHLKWQHDPDTGTWKKVLVKQDKGKNTSWKAVRISLFKEPLGKIKLREYKSMDVKQAILLQLAYMTNPNQLAPQIANKAMRNKAKAFIKENGFDLKKIELSLKKNPMLDAEDKKIERLDVLFYNTYASKRVTIDKTFKMTKINTIPDAKNNRIAKTLAEHLQEYSSEEIAFQNEGKEELNKKIGRNINKITTYQAVGEKYDFGSKLFETDKGGNVYFAIHQKCDETGKPEIRIKDGNIEFERDYKTLPLFGQAGREEEGVIYRLMNKLPLVEPKEGWQTIILSPNDLVYVPEPDELSNIDAIDFKLAAKKPNRIYKMVSSTGKECHFVPNSFASLIMPYDGKLKKGELGSLNKQEKTLDKKQTIKAVCIKIKTDRLGRIVEANGKRIE